MLSIIRWILAVPLALIFWGIIGTAGAESGESATFGRYLFVSAMAFGVGGTVMRGVTPAAHRRAAAVVWSVLMSVLYIGVALVLPVLIGETHARMSIKPAWPLAMVVVACAYLFHEWNSTDSTVRPLTK